MKTSRRKVNQKARRDQLGGRRGAGHEFQRRERRVRRPDARRIRIGGGDRSLTGVAGLVAFGAFTRSIELERRLAQGFDHMKQGRGVVYSMGTQLRTLIDVAVVGEQRVFGLEALAADPLFTQLAGGSIPSIDTMYRDLARADELDVATCELLMAGEGLQTLRSARGTPRLHCDIDTTVETVFGRQEGAEVGYNPRHPGRRSYQPLLAVVAETGACVGAKLRPGDTSLGASDASTIGAYVERVVAHAPSGSKVVARIDCGGDCTEILSRLDAAAGALFVVKLRLTPDVVGALVTADAWTTVEEGADGEPLVQVTELSWARDEWKKAGKPFRVCAVRRRDRDSGKQVQLWADLDYSATAFVTNDHASAPEQIAAEYDARAEIEPRIAELKNGLGIGKVPTQDFNANHLMLQVKLLAHNLVRRYVSEHVPQLRTWRSPWLTRALFCVPGRLSRSGRQIALHVHPASRIFELQRQLC